ncbi:hypothetical protein Q428_08530 [Fervidicella metallireducens AeB]|uniref:Uncharacterized protein n=1 Tax=Fervidicella metallireducens AeB TaxID=1403537 RepID=A0A017RV93_9CLOT|nr:MoaD/ThiS family protein [Fervidicella metallireducens]EYE88344.1 hypothetical protein Q428_08530 [Fervidicella metallireducens AeB]
MIKITVKAFSFLEKFITETTLTLPEGVSCEDVLRRLNIPKKDVFVCIVNGSNVPFNTKLKDNDSLSLLPHLEGG